MKKLLLLSISMLFIISFPSKLVFAQKTSSCKVLLESISGFYEGGCKDSLAHGRGYAEGKDKYKGRFRAGLPDGTGIYYFRNGDYYNGNFKNGKKVGKGEYFSAINNKTIKGIWKDDVMDREITDPPYEIIQNFNLTGLSFSEKTGGVPNSVEFVFNREGRVSYDFPSLTLIATTGNLIRNSNYSGFDYVEFPVEIYLSFSAPSRFNATVVKYDAKIKINKPGAWKVIVRY
jgi:hypothetical protein